MYRVSIKPCRFESLYHYFTFNSVRLNISDFSFFIFSLRFSEWFSEVFTILTRMERRIEDIAVGGNIVETSDANNVLDTMEGVVNLFQELRDDHNTRCVFVSYVVISTNFIDKSDPIY